MRVIHVAPTVFGPDGLYGGGERYPLELARALAAEVDCELVTFGPRPGRWREPAGLRVRVLRPLGRLRGHPAQPVTPLLPPALAGAQIVHAHQFRSVPSRLAAVTARARGAATAVTDHGLPGRTWGGLVHRLFDRYLTVSRFSAEVLGAPPARTEVIYGGADPRRFAPQPGGDRDGVLFVGRLTPHKGVDRLIRALPAGAGLRIAGSGGHDPRPPERDYPDLLRRLAEGRDVRFLGPVSEEDLPGLYRSAAVLAMPSVDRTCYGRPVPVSELLGLTALEAMASGTPVVASRIGGLAEVVVDGETGFLVEPGDLAALHDRLALVLSDRRLAARLGANARELVTRQFTWRACAERCLAAYRALA
ncbi:MAG TPA: glycosyltransferase family 4 protein [Actinomycetes bacterium]|jgi:glycosyltransferase involved in cell wall biosynthesis|nr:glycosyltransferase family 4 protein [Actinomycetes bacterium]